MYVRSFGFYPDTSLLSARVVRLAFLFLRSLAPNQIRVQNIVHCVGCHPTNMLLCFLRYFAKYPLKWKTIFFALQNNQISKKYNFWSKRPAKICMYPTTLNLYVHPNFDQKKRCINTMLNACGLNNNYHTFCYKYIKNHP